MNLHRHTLYLVGGIGMVVGSFFAAAKALGGALALIYFMTSTNFGSIDRSIAEQLENTYKTGMISQSIEGIGAFLILFLGGRWMLRGPKIIDQWIESGVSNSIGNTPKENENTRSEQDVSGNGG